MKGKRAIGLLSKNWQVRNYLLISPNFPGDFMRNCDVVYGMYIHFAILTCARTNKSIFCDFDLCPDIIEIHILRF